MSHSTGSKEHFGLFKGGKEGEEVDVGFFYDYTLIIKESQFFF